jgi:hypothetical protein
LTESLQQAWSGRFITIKTPVPKQSNHMEAWTPPTMSVDEAHYVLNHLIQPISHVLSDDRSAMTDFARIVAPASGVGQQPFYRLHEPFSRQECDNCQTTLFSTHWMCHLCGMEFCSCCVRSWPDERKLRCCLFKKSHVSPLVLDTSGSAKSEPSLVMVYKITALELDQFTKDMESQGKMVADVPMIDGKESMGSCECNILHEFTTLSEPVAVKVSKARGRPSTKRQKSVDTLSVETKLGSDSPIASTLSAVESSIDDASTNASQAEPIEAETKMESASSIASTVVSDAPIPSALESSLHDTNTVDDASQYALTEMETKLSCVSDDGLAKSANESSIAPNAVSSSVEPDIAGLPVQYIDVIDLTKDMFKELIAAARPFVVSGLLDLLDEDTLEIWSAEEFLENYGKSEGTVFDCATGHADKSLTLAHFFKGMIDPSKKPLDKDGNLRILKLKVMN